MKKQIVTKKSATISVLIALLTLFFLSFTASVFSDVDTEERFGITFPELSPITMPKIKEYKLNNGMIFLLCEDHSFPTITMEAQINAGSRYDAPDKIGTASITAQLLRSGGTRSYSPAELDKLLDSMAITLSSSSALLTARLYTDFLAEDLDTALNLFNEVLRNPAFSEGTLTRVKMGMNSSISRRNDNIDNIAFREFHKLVYGADHPYARHTEYRTIQNIEREDLINYHQRHYQPQNTYVFVLGDFKTKEMIKKLNKTFGKWEVKKSIPSEGINEEITFSKSVNLVSRPDSEQTWIVIGHRAMITQRDDDFIPMIVLNDILGGGFRGRIYRRIRNQLGLAYSPGAYYSVDIDDTPGAFYLMSQTKTDRTVEAIEALIDEIRIIQNEPVTAEELKLAKESYLNSFIFNYDSKWKILRRQLAYMRFGYPIDFMEKVRDKVNNVTIEDIQRVAKKYLRPDDFTILVVGNENEFDKPLSSLGEVNEIDITIPPLTRKTEEKTEEITEAQLQQGLEVFHSYRTKAGLDKEITSLHTKCISTKYAGSDSSRVNMETFISFPNLFREDIATPNGSISTIFNNGKTITKTPAGNFNLSAEFKDKIINGIRTNPIGLTNYYYNDFEISLLREVRIDGRDCYVLSFRDEDGFFLLFIDKKDMLPYQSVYDDLQQMATIYTRFSDYQFIDGTAYPMKVITQDETGTVLSREVYSSIEINEDLSEELFSIE